MSKNKKIPEVEAKPEVVMTEQVILETLESEIDKTRLELENVKRELEEKKKEAKSMPMREVDEDEMVIVKKQQAGFVKNAALKEKIEAQKKLDNEMITGKFINKRSPGQGIKLPYHKYEDDPVKWYPLEDGKVYTIPRGFVEQINEHYYTPHFIQKNEIMDPDAPSSSIHAVDTTNKKYMFVPVNF